MAQAQLRAVEECGDWRDTRDRRVVENLTLARVIAIRIREGLPAQVDLEDLIHAGVMGLIDAAEKFDDSKNTSFQTYAKHRIRGAILDSLRQMDWASRDLRRRQKQAEETSRELTAKLGRVPSESEVASEMGLPLEKFRRISMELQSRGGAATAPDTVSEDRDVIEECPAAPDLRPDRMCEKSELRSALNRAIGDLPLRCRKVVFLYYTNDMTMREIGDVLGVKESRVSQIHTFALKKMATTLESAGIRSAAVF